MDRARVYARAYVPWRKLLGRRMVRREVQGVPLYLPWTHLLPDFARARPTYGQNLVELAKGLARNEPQLTLLDVGANVGDSALQVLHHVPDAVALCVEGDHYWLGYLRRNVAANPRVTVAGAFLAADDSTESSAALSAVRGGGTTKFVPGASDDAVRRVSVDELRKQYPAFDRVRLVKSDTDGFDPELVVAIAETWSDAGPVLFFEFDPGLAREVAGGDPNLVWDRLAELGYARVAVWDNTGDSLGQLDIRAARAAAAGLEPPPVRAGYHFWDVAVCRADDAAALAVFDQLVPEPYDPLGMAC